MSQLQSPRGTRDILPEQQAVWQWVKHVASLTATRLGYQELTIPTYEESKLFQRAIGDGTDIVDKELFMVRGKHAEEDSYALRPEGTAGFVRAYIEHGMHTWPQPVKLFTILNCFRYERPQKGRYREFFQFSAEYFGDSEPFADAWSIYMGWVFLSKVGLENLELRLNTLGTVAEREKYIAALVAYLTPHKEKLSLDSQNRLDKNPLRILDSKDQGDQEICKDAPELSEYLEDASKTHFTTVQSYLETWKIPFRVDPKIIRGLDYYEHTAFEWTVKTKTGQQDSLGGGGRYDGLISQLGGPATGGVGFAIGLDRVVEEVVAQEKQSHIKAYVPEVYLIAADETGQAELPEIIAALAHKGIGLDCNLSKINVSNQLKAASRLKARYAVICGKAELDNGHVILKNLESGDQQLIKPSDIATLVRERNEK